MHGNMVSLIYRQAEGGQSKQQTNKRTKQKAMYREQGGQCWRRSQTEGGGGVRQEEEESDR